MKNANKGQHKSPHAFMTLLLFSKTLQCKLEIWEKTLHRLHLLGFIFPHFRILPIIPSTPFGLGSVFAAALEGSGTFLVITDSKRFSPKKETWETLRDQGRPRARTGTEGLWNRYKPSFQNFCSWLIPPPHHQILLWSHTRMKLGKWSYKATTGIRLAKPAFIDRK